jgi:hypothetical protein
MASTRALLVHNPYSLRGPSSVGVTPLTSPPPSQTCSITGLPVSDRPNPYREKLSAYIRNSRKPTSAPSTPCIPTASPSAQNPYYKRLMTYIKKNRRAAPATASRCGFKSVFVSDMLDRPQCSSLPLPGDRSENSQSFDTVHRLSYSDLMSEPTTPFQFNPGASCSSFEFQWRPGCSKSMDDALPPNRHASLPTSGDEGSECEDDEGGDTSVFGERRNSFPAHRRQSSMDRPHSL